MAVTAKANTQGESNLPAKKKSDALCVRRMALMPQKKQYAQYIVRKMNSQFVPSLTIVLHQRFGCLRHACPEFWVVSVDKSRTGTL